MVIRYVKYERGTCLKRKINICTMCSLNGGESECQVHVDRVSKPKLYTTAVCVEATCSALAMKHVRRSEKCIFIIAARA